MNLRPFSISSLRLIEILIQLETEVQNVAFEFSFSNLNK